MTTDITNTSDYKQIKVIIKSELESLASGFVALGFYLKKVRDEKLYIEGNYKDIFEFAKNEYNLSRSVTSRWISINDKFSIGGNSPEIADDYRNYGSSLLSEMLTLPEENYVLVTENTTVAQIRDMKKEFTEDDRIPGQMEITNYPQYMPENAHCDVAQENDTLAIFIKWYFANEGKENFEQMLKILNGRGEMEEHSEKIMYLIAPSKFKVFRISEDGRMFNIVCNDNGISILELGAEKEEFTYHEIIPRFVHLFGLDGSAEEIYKTYYNVDLKAPEKVETTQPDARCDVAQTEPVKEVKKAPTKSEKQEIFMNEPEEETEEIEEITESPENIPKAAEKVTETIKEGQEDEIVDKEEQKCRICGCTWNNACEGGCYWVEEDLCSKCAAGSREKGEEDEEIEIIEAEIVEPIKYKTIEETITWHVLEDAPTCDRDVLLARKEKVGQYEKVVVTTGNYKEGKYTSNDSEEYQYWANMPFLILSTN